ncbi:hypothetical protein SISNIDRAFT_491805 [Sistotremastrum niveocremeum HHB9708]|uniref:Uncharacterized protein n=1 Tax=Sistotremastrum niveocremeum HHB9708 TaxID=1314777 RepID=A0A164MDF9_9AGAM|nr:hypothetical protein SISNIDRAFT_491805 [Sistotremastrum niveocremeum HHB9708]
MTASQILSSPAFFDVQTFIFSYLPIPLLIILMRHKPSLAPAITHGALTAYQRHLTPYFENVEGFRDLMRTYNILLTGSTALAIWLSPVTWKPHNLNLFCSYTAGTKLQHFLLAHGFVSSYGPHLRSIEEFIPPTSPNDIIHHRFRYHKCDNANTIIDILVTSDTNPIHLLFECHATACMNYMTADSIVSLYPELTNLRHTLFQDHLYHNEAHRLRSRYHIRGFTSILPQVIVFLHHETVLRLIHPQQSPHRRCNLKCGNLIRFVGDTATSHLSFSNSHDLQKQMCDYASWWIEVPNNCRHPLHRDEHPPENHT